jgi:polysaccharide biosynthesis transport protein
MYPAAAPGLTGRDVCSYLIHYPKRWLIPAAVMTAAVTVYAVFKPNVYEASLPLMMRNEVSTDAQAPGKFRHEDEMKISEETVMEVTSGRLVLTGALKQVGPPIDAKIVGVWPGDESIDSLRAAIKVAPPKGAEFGKTEIFYLKVADRDPRRAIALADAIYDQLKANLGAIRNNRARGIVADLEKVVALADADLQQDTQRLKQMEQETGADLIELRMVFQGTAMDGELNKTLVAGQTELRQWKAAQAVNREMLRLLQAAQRDPQQLVAAPAPLLDSQPTLRQLKQGLGEAQLRASVLAGTLTEDHPQLAVARQAEQDIKQVIFKEVATAARGIEADIQLTESRIRNAEEQLGVQQRRIERLAALRAEYSNLVDQVEHHRAELDQAKHYLAETLASQAASPSSSVINRVGEPDGTSTPIGPTRASIALMGLASGLLSGLGILYLTAPPRLPPYRLHGDFYRTAMPFYPDGSPASRYPQEAWQPELALPLYPNGDVAHRPR